MEKRVVVITGSTSGYGLAMARKFKELGDKVVIVSRNEEKVRQVVEENGFDDSFVLDVTNYDGWVELKNYILKKYGHIDILVNNAGGGVKIEPIAHQTKESIDDIISLNLNSVIYASSIFAPVFQKQRDGLIINISSVCARHCWSDWSVYAAAKAGVLNFSKGLYVDLQPYGVRVSCVIPAAATTNFNKSAGLDDSELSLKVDDIANAVIYIANQPKTVNVEEVTVWGTSQVVNPL